MLLLLGGPPRCGKTTFAAAAAGRRAIGWLSTDVIRSVVNVHMPLYDDDGLFGFYPRHVDRLDARIPRRAVFVGQSKVTLEDVFAHEGRNLWHRELDDETLARLPAWIEEWSAEIEAECLALGYPYVDLAAGDFAERYGEVERLLF